MKYMLASVVIIAAALVFAVWSFQERFLFFPEKLPQSYQYRFGNLHFDEKFIKNGDASLNGLLFRSAKPKGIIIYFHGNAGSLRTWGNVAFDLLNYDYDVFIYDYRGYGKSTGPLSEESLFADAAAVYDHFAGNYGKVILYGRSIGSGMAVWLAREKHPDRLLLEAPLYNLQELAAVHYPWLPASLLRYHFRNDIYMKELRCPVFVIHGDHDNVVPVSASVKLSEVSLTQMKMTMVKGGSHNDLSRFPEYASWLNESLDLD